MTTLPRSASVSSSFCTARSESVNGLFWMTAILLAASFFAAEHDVFISRHFGSAFDETGITERGGLTAADSILYRVGFLGFGVLGFALLLSPPQRPLRRPGIFVWLMAADGTICIGSIFWCETPSSTALNLLPWVCFGTGVLGLARQFTVRDLAKLVVVVMASNLAIGVAAEVLLGTFNPQSARYQFAGTLSPEGQGIQCSLFVLSALAVLRHTRRNLPLHLGFIAIGVLFLLLTKSQSSCCAFLVAVMVELHLQPRSGRQWPNWTWAPGFVVALLTVAALMDRSGAMEVINNVGVLGATACLVIAILGMWQAWRRYQWTQDEGYRFLVAQIVLALVNSLSNTQYLVPSLCAAACAASLASLAMTPTDSAQESSLPAIRSSRPATQMASRVA